MNKQKAYIEALESAVRAVDQAFAHANAVEVVRPIHTMAERWRMTEEERVAAERADVAAYNVEPDHWAARLALMSAWESLHAALGMMASADAHDDPHSPAWPEAAARSREAGRLAGEAAQVFHDAPRAWQGTAPVRPASEAASEPAASAMETGWDEDAPLTVR